MKVALVATFLLFIWAVPGEAQPYQSIFGQNSTRWVFKYNWQGQWNFIDSVYVEKDTSVHGTQYKKIVSPPGMQRPWLVREDLNTGSVWARYTKPYTVLGWEDTLEKLLFRMDFNVGDTFDIYWLAPNYASQYPDSLKVVDSVKMINGRKRIYFRGKAEQYQMQNEPFTVIEGIGSNMGMVWKYEGALWGGHYLLCSYKDGQKTDYQNLFYSGDCKPPLSVQELLENDSVVRVYPNPTNGALTIETGLAGNYDIDIYNAFGSRVYSDKMVDRSKHTIHLDERLPAGNYSIQIRSKDINYTGRISVIR